MILTRVPLKALASPDRAIEYLARDGSWKRGLLWQDAAVVLERGATELSVRYHPSEERWVEVQTNPVLGSDEIVARTAPDLAGPWSSFQTVFRIPELSRAAAVYDKDTFCYAAKEHAQFGVVSGMPC